MVKRIKLNMEEIESMLYFWQASKDRERVSEHYLNELAALPGISSCYDNEFNAESVRKVLSAITNRELLSNKTPKEGRFWNNNMWMMEDLSYTYRMIQPLKKLNVDSLIEKLGQLDSVSEIEEVEVIFAPLHMDDYLISGNKLIVNFFRVKPDGDSMEENEMLPETATIDGVELKSYIEDKIKQVLK